MAEFKSFAAIFRDAHEQPAPAISPLISAPPAEASPEPRIDRLPLARIAERIDRAIAVLLREIACEVLGRELLLAPVEVDAVVARLRERYTLREPLDVRAIAGDVVIEFQGGGLDASLGRRLESAIVRAGDDR